MQEKGDQMTIVFSVAALDIICMTADSAIMLDIVYAAREYETGAKSFAVPGVGCVTTWGDMVHNRIARFLSEQNVTPTTHSVHELALLVQKYLAEAYRPHEFGTEVGYHVAGFDRDGCPQLFHIFYGFDRPRPPEQNEMKYEMYRHSPQPNSVQFLNNGREEFADTVVTTFLGQLQAGNALHTRFAGKAGLVALGDLVVRFAAELTPEVGPPFVTRIINPKNEIANLRNDSLCPVSGSVMVEQLKSLGYSV
jgi:hypothetical protein